MSKKKKKKPCPVCDYCGNKARLVDGSVVYPHRPDLASKSFYYCDNGHGPAYVGCHAGTTNVLGRLADAELRRWKSIAHGVFDPIWKNKLVRRGDAYAWLAKELGIEAKHCHIGSFDVERCKQVYAVCKRYGSNSAAPAAEADAVNTTERPEIHEGA